MSRTVVSLLLACGSLSALADGAVKVGTYRLAKPTQQIGGENVQFYGLPSVALDITFSQAPKPDSTWLNPVYSVEVFHVGYDIDPASAASGSITNTAGLFNLNWTFGSSATLRPYFGLGAGLNYVDFSMAHTSSYQYENELALAAQAFVGAEFRPSKKSLGIVGEIKYFDSAANIDTAGAAAFAGFSLDLR